MSELTDNLKGWLDEDPRVVAATLLGIFTFVILSIMLHKEEKRKKALKQQAIENNTVVSAYMVSHYRSHDSESNTTYYHGTYRYTLNGKSKKYSIYSEYGLPDVISLYPKNIKGTKFFSEYDRNVHAGIAFNVLAAIAVCVFTLIITRLIF